MKFNIKNIKNIISEEITNIFETYDDFSDLDGSGKEMTSFEPESDSDRAIQVAISALLEELYQYDPRQEALDNLENEAKLALDSLRELIERITSGEERL